nr:family 20 glycosylhydrolase [Microbacterium bovistercoris]
MTALVRMTALVPIPAAQTTDAAADPFVLTDATRLVAVPATRGTAELAASALAPHVGRTLEIVADRDTRRGDIVLAQLAQGAPETYTLIVDADGVRITGGDEAGLFYGVQTLVQLLATSAAASAQASTATSPTASTATSAQAFAATSTATSVTIPATRIEDAPRYAYRGVMLDVARHFFPVEVVCGYIDRAAALKFNALHLHLTDDQGWRIQVPSRPELTERASGSAASGDAGGLYTTEDYARIVAHAAARHMVVVPEIDGPSHTHAIGLAHPELMEPVVITDQVTEVVDAFGGGIPIQGEPYTGFAVGFSSLKTRSEQTYALLADVCRDLAAMTPGPYLHVGGDEALGTSDADFAEYMRRVTAIAADLGKTPIAWHEAGAAAGLVPGTIGQYWGYVSPTDGMDDKARAFPAGGGRMILSPADAVYLDMKYDADSPLGLTWANGPTSVRRAYDWEPTAVIAGLADSDILGVEAPLWTETIRTAAHLDAQAFPRIAAAAEIAWSPAAAPERTWASFRERVGMLGPLWTAAGIGFFASPEIEWSASR